MYRTPNPVRSTSQLSQLPTAAINRTIFSSNKRDQYLPIIKQISELFALPIPFTTRDIHVMDVNKVPFIIYHLIIDIDHNAIFQNGNIPNSNDNGNNQTSNNLLFSFRFHIIQKLTAFETLLINNNNNKAREKINFVELMFTYENNSDTDDRRDLFIRTLNMLCNFKIFLNELMDIFEAELANNDETELQEKRINELQSRLMPLKKEKEQKRKIRHRIDAERESIEKMEKHLQEQMKLLNDLI